MSLADYAKPVVFVDGREVKYGEEHDHDSDDVIILNEGLVGFAIFGCTINASISPRHVGQYHLFCYTMNGVERKATCRITRVQPASDGVPGFFCIDVYADSRIKRSSDTIDRMVFW